MKQTVATSALVLAAALFSLPAQAGEHVFGVWSTDDDRAMKTAFTMAESKVRSRGRGCVGRGRGDTSTEELIVQQNGDKVRYGVFISHHDGSCGIKKTIIENMSRETGIDVGRIAAAWATGQ